MCEFMFLSNLSYQKVLISGLFSSVAITRDGADAFCLHVCNKRFIFVSWRLIKFGSYEEYI